MENASTIPDLQSILATLASYAPPQQPAPPMLNGEGFSNSVSNEADPIERSAPRPSEAVVEKVEDPRLKPQCHSTESPKSMIDPATITTWQDGLRCVTKIAAQNAQFAARIRTMMEDQRKHEMRWYAERQALKNTRASRANSTAQARSILQSLNNGTGSAAEDCPLDPEVELEAFDRKVYAAQKAMEVSMTAELKGLGVPFFGTDRTLVVRDEDAGAIVDGQPKWSPQVTEMQLLELRRRMVGHLEDLYRD